MFAVQLSTASHAGEDAGIAFMVLIVHCKTALLNSKVLCNSSRHFLNREEVKRQLNPSVMFFVSTLSGTDLM